MGELLKCFVFDGVAVLFVREYPFFDLADVLFNSSDRNFGEVGEAFCKSGLKISKDTQQIISRYCGGRVEKLVKPM